MTTQNEQIIANVMVSHFTNLVFFQQLPQIAKPFVEENIVSAVESVAPLILDEVNTQSNFELNEIPKNIAGFINPVNTISSNLSSADLSNLLNTTLAASTQQKYTNQLIQQLTINLNSNLTNSIAEIVDVSLLITNLSQEAATAVAGGINQAVTSFSSNLVGRRSISTPSISTLTSSISSFLPNLSGLPDLSNLNNLTGLNLADIIRGFLPTTSQQQEQINLQFDISTANDALNEASRFNTKSVENEEKLITQTTGFIDQAAEYPTKEYAEKSEVNKLATGDINGTIVQKKNNSRATAQLPNGKQFQQPDVPFKGEYPFNKVIETESGHIVEMDDTPGAERIHVYHRSGTFIEIDSNGTIVKKTRGSSYEFIDNNGYISITGDGNLSVNGTLNVFIGGDANIEVEGDASLKCLNNATIQAAGILNLSATEELNLRSGNIYIEAINDLSIKSSNTMYVASHLPMYIKSNNDIHVETSNNFYLISTEDLRFQSLEKNIHMLAGIDFNLDTSRYVFIQSERAIEPIESQQALSSNIGTIGDRKNIVYENVPDPKTFNLLDKFGYEAEDSENEQEAKASQEKMQRLGVLSKKELEQEAVVIESISPSSTNNRVIQPDDSLLTQTFLPDNYQLSKHFTLASVSSKAAVTNNPVRAQVGLSYGQIVFNLQGIALNVLEPVLSLYPNMLVTSAFRFANNSASTSDHPRGKAVDIQFPGVSKSEYYNIAKKLSTLINYDKLLLEYKSYGTKLPWIHISFDVTRNRKIVLTYYNDKKYGDGLISLA